MSFLSSYVLEPVTETDFKVDEYFFASIEEAYKGHYLEALKNTKKIIALVPEHPAGYLYTSVVLSWIIDTFYNYDYAKEFLEMTEKTISLSKSMIQKNRLDPWGYVYLGGAYGFRGIYYSIVGDFFYAFIDGVKGNYNIKKAVDLNPEIYDNYFGVGTFEFWRAYYTGKFFWLSGGDENKQKGIDKVLLAIEKGKYTSKEASFSLVRIYLSDKKYRKAINTGSAILKKSPVSIKIRRFMGEAQIKVGDSEDAVKTFLKMRELLVAHRLTTPAALLDANIRLAKAQLAMNKKNEAIKILNNSNRLVKKIKMKNEFLEKLVAEYNELYDLVQKN